MRKGKIYITLKSDLCVGDGSVYNSIIDTDVCKDDYGIPFIPAKRLRGCLRECAVELKDWGMAIEAKELFGDEGDKRAFVRIGNAYIKGYGEYVEELEANCGHVLFHPQNVLNQFTYLRTQTAINNETGAADSTTLRTIRVINKGETLISEVEINDDGLQDAELNNIINQLKACCSVLRHMGIARTRGYGEVEVCFEDEGMINEITEGLHMPYQEGADKLTYTIELLEPMILKSTNGEEENTQDYIEGSKILGLVAQAMNDRHEDVAGFLSGDTLFFSNAYISRDGVRLIEAPAVYYDVKNHKEQYRNKLYDSMENREKHDKDLQLNQMKHCYVLRETDGSIRKLDVDIEERYHHRRPTDKSIGRAAAKLEANAHFYQISSISPGQTFAGMVLGSPDEIKSVYSILSQKDCVHMGYGRSSEYGLARIRITGTEKQEAAIPVTGHDYAVMLKAPTIVYSDNACYSIDSSDLIEEINAALGVRCSVSAKYMKYVMSGGFNVTWGKRKPTIDAFGAGTVIVFHSDEVLHFSAPAVLKLGERTREGFGEAEVMQFNPLEAGYSGNVISDKPVGSESVALDVKQYPLAERIGIKLFETYIRTEAAKDAGAYFNKKAGLKPTISNLTLMNKELLEDQNHQGAYARIVGIAEERYGKNTERKREKLKLAKKLLEYADMESKNLKSKFAEEYHLNNFIYDQDLLYLRYLEAFLMHGKYMLHDIDDQDIETGEETSDEQ